MMCIVPDALKKNNKRGKKEYVLVVVEEEKKKTPSLTSSISKTTKTTIPSPQECEKELEEVLFDKEVDETLAASLKPEEQT